MASNKRTITVDMDASGITKSLAAINREMAVTDARFKEAEAEARVYGDEQELLGVKQDKLREKIRLQGEKVQVLKEAYDKAKDSGEASEKQLSNLEKQYLDAKTALVKYEGELQDTDDATKTFGDTVRDMASAIGVEVNPMVEKLASKFDGVSAAMGAGVLVAGTVITSLTSMSVKLANTADDLLTLSSQTHISTDELQKLQYAADFVDVEVSTMTGSITRLTKSMDEARHGSGNASEAFHKLHINVKNANGSLRNANDVFYESIDALGRIGNETERDSIAMEIFGRSARDLNPLIDAGSQKLKDLGIEAENVGYVIGEKDLEAAGKFKDELDKMNKSTETLTRQLGEAFLPVLTKIVDTLNETMKSMSDPKSPVIQGYGGLWVKMLMDAEDDGSSSSVSGPTQKPNYTILSNGKRRYPAQGKNTWSSLDGTASNQTINYNNITIDAKNVKDFNDVVEVVKGLEQAERRN